MGWSEVYIYIQVEKCSILLLGLYRLIFLQLLLEINQHPPPHDCQKCSIVWTLRNPSGPSQGAEEVGSRDVKGHQKVADERPTRSSSAPEAALPKALPMCVWNLRQLDMAVTSC